jgi:2-isopropylmalate synthase
MKNKIIIFDTTLRDGEQSAGASLTLNEKLQIAYQLEKLGVDVIEAGFPISSPGEFEAVKLISKKIKKCVVCALSRAVKKDIETAYQAIKSAKKPRIHTFIMTSDIQIKYQLKKTKDEVLKMVEDAVKFARKLCEDVEFSAMDASRTDWDYLVKVFSVALEYGAKTLNVPDTVGYSMPWEFGNLIKYLKENIPDVEKSIISVHCHNDLGLAVANVLEAIKAGARQIECTVNGIGERAGNTSLEEVVMGIKVRNDLLNYETGINTKEIYRSSRLVSELTGIPVQPNKAIVGANAFSHQSGIHQNGVLKEKSTYEIMKPETIGIPSSRIVLGKLSGRHAFKKKIEEFGYHLKEQELERAFLKFKELADKKKIVEDEDLIAIVTEEVKKIPQIYTLEYLHISSGNKTIPTATVKLKTDKKVIQEAACGDGPVDALCKAINRIVKRNPKLISYSLKAVTGGTEALGEVNVKIQDGKDIFFGKGISTDIVEASAKAYLNAINKLVYTKK